MREDDDRREIALEDLIHVLGQIARAALDAFLVAQAAEVGLDDGLVEAEEGRDARHGHDESRGPDGPGVLADEAGQQRGRPGLRDLFLAVVDGEGAVEQRQRGRQHGEGADPAQDHADQADQPELVEAAEVREDERAVGKARGERRRPGGGGRVNHRDHRRPLVADAAPALLEVAPEEYDPEVDAVSDDDAAQERRVGVQVSHGEEGGAERPETADEHAVDEEHRAADAPEEDEHGQADRGEDDYRGDPEVADQRVVLLERFLHAARVADLHVRRVRRRIERLDRSGNSRLELLLHGDRRALARHVREEDAHLRVGRRVEAFGEAVVPGHTAHVLAAEGLEVEIGLRDLAAAEDVDRVMELLLVFDPVGDEVADALEVLDLHVKRLALAEELELAVDAVLGSRDRRAGNLVQALGEIEDESLRGLDVVGEHENREMVDRLEALGHLVEIDDASCGGGEEFLDVRAKAFVELDRVVEPESARECSEQRDKT